MHSSSRLFASVVRNVPQTRATAKARQQPLRVCALLERELGQNLPHDNEAIGCIAMRVTFGSGSRSGAKLSVTLYVQYRTYVVKLQL